MGNAPLQSYWQEVAFHWGLRLEAPFTVELSFGSITVPVLLRDFGSPKGMLLATNYDSVSKHENELIELGFGYSCLSEPTEPYNPEKDDEDVREMLADWGWSGSGDPPSRLANIPHAELWNPILCELSGHLDCGRTVVRIVPAVASPSEAGVVFEMSDGSTQTFGVSPGALQEFWDHAKAVLADLKDLCSLQPLAPELVSRLEPARREWEAGRVEHEREESERLLLSTIRNADAPFREKDFARVVAILERIPQGKLTDVYKAKLAYARRMVEEAS